MPEAAVAARVRSARSGTSGGTTMCPWSWNGCIGWCCRCASDANVSITQHYHATGLRARGRYPRCVPSQTVGVWIVDLEQPPAVVDALRAHLDDTEVLEAAGRRDDTLRNRYVVAHGALREVLAGCLATKPDAVVIERRCRHCGDPAHGKPEIAGSTLSFNLSHSDSYAVIAVAAGTRVGIDIEEMHPRARLDA